MWRYVSSVTGSLNLAFFSSWSIVCCFVHSGFFSVKHVFVMYYKVGHTLLGGDLGQKRGRLPHALGHDVQLDAMCANLRAVIGESMWSCTHCDHTSQSRWDFAASKLDKSDTQHLSLRNSLMAIGSKRPSFKALLRNMYETLMQHRSRGQTFPGRTRPGWCRGTCPQRYQCSRAASTCPAPSQSPTTQTTG